MRFSYFRTYSFAQIIKDELLFAKQEVNRVMSFV